LQSDPRIVMCSSDACRARFGNLDHGGLTVANHVVFVSGRGITPEVLLHELVHAETHARVGLAALALGRLPAWFDEGLAVIVSGDTRFLRSVAPAEIRRVRQARHFTQWSRFAAEPDRAYAAAAAVEALRTRIGDAGLKRVVARIGAGLDFDAALGAE
jgi:hypothetical protein